MLSVSAEGVVKMSLCMIRKLAKLKSSGSTVEPCGTPQEHLFSQGILDFYNKSECTLELRQKYFNAHQWLCCVCQTLQLNLNIPWQLMYWHYHSWEWVDMLSDDPSHCTSTTGLGKISVCLLNNQYPSQRQICWADSVYNLFVVCLCM